MSLLREATEFIRLFHLETNTPDQADARCQAVALEIERTGTYQHTPEELSHGAKVAWRNTTQCAGKFYWQQLKVRDLRHLSTPEEVFGGLVDHLRLATNGGQTRLLLTVFAPQQPNAAGPRVWNPQLVRYAGYRQENGGVWGDPANVDLTELVQRHGWRGQGSRFDVLPLVIQVPGQHPRLFELPPDAVLEVPIEHPHFGWFKDLGLKWHSHPAISNQRLEIGGISYPLAPFSAWYTSAEIGARNFSDTSRYDMLPMIAKLMGLDTSTHRTLWKDRALVELTYAVQYSFELHGVTILDHHAVARQFVIHEEREAKAGRVTPMDWRMLVPPLSGSTTPTFERRYSEVALKPNFFALPDPWARATPDPASPPRGCPMHITSPEAQTQEA
jgi:nitric-oxide synthase